MIVWTASAATVTLGMLDVSTTQPAGGTTVRAAAPMATCPKNASPAESDRTERAELLNVTIATVALSTGSAFSR
jgi:hypothetical protein